MNIPEKVKILYKEYTVEEQENLHDGSTDLYGQVEKLGTAMYMLIRDNPHMFGGGS